ncbi:hypothetical protein QM467_15835 [Rhodoblastus sp. 17X3]|uniref:hypothetical protein n=1 Tax=Rhodoblastus sp. 17X3 TaxID=3047026 RepID=UPI0024B7C489|nr:hypothetical protein [Rhodoblastus sp. 17X3]MDI9849526.1 hypothetical protein [Rhodoblastus sp. 17X3]
MLHRISLLEELKKGGFEASLITTYNAYLPFYEEVVLRRMVGAGIRHNVLLMDAAQYALSLKGNPPRLAGRQYSLLPMTVQGAFHPKLIFLAGKNKGLILIGSHNMTVAGFGFNRELTGLVRIEGEKDAPGIALANDALAAVEYWLQNFTRGLPEHTRKMVQRVRDFAPWLKNEASPNAELRLLAGHPGGALLWDQFKQLLEGDTERVGVSGAFFDRKLGFIARVKDDLKPKRLTVAVDPATVELDQSAKSLVGVSFADAAKLGLENENDTGGYLHAKSIYVESGNGNSVFAVGSANPSRPAWLADADGGNVELMLAYRGDDARAAANATGLDTVHALPLLDEAGWQTIAETLEAEADSKAEGPQTGVALAERDRIEFDSQLCEGSTSMVFTLCNENGAEISRTTTHRIEGAMFVVEFPSVPAAATFLDGYHRDVHSLKLLIHHAGLVEEHARTGNQRRLKDALQSLDTDTPNIELLVQCLDKIVFGDDQPSQPTIKKNAGGDDQAKANDPEDKGTLMISVDEMKKPGGKQRLHHSSDFGYLLDALIYHLGMREDKPQEDLDRFGRNEEERVGTDDDPVTEVDPISPEKQAELLDICHSKVRTIVRRITTQLTACAEGKQPFPAVAIRLLGVLAVLRELRRCDGRAAWVEKGKTTVPQEERRKLLQAIMFTLFERNAKGLSLLDLRQADEAFRDSDDIARLKGLVLWLAWDCGLTLDLQKPFMESPEDLQNRLQGNAMVLALAQLIRRDEVVLDEAQQSIGSLTSSELDWLEAIHTLATQCDTLLENPTNLLPSQMAEPGYIAVHRTIRPWDLRIVRSQNNKQISLIRLTKDGRPLSYLSDNLSVVQFNQQAG